MMIRRAVVIAGLLLCTLQFSPTPWASPRSAMLTPPAQDMNFTLEGKITEKTEGKLTLSGGDNVIFHVEYNDKTEIKKKDGSPGTAQDLQVGVTVSAAGDLAESGVITAKKITIEGESSEKH
jgi:hypothetical protein